MHICNIFLRFTRPNQWISQCVLLNHQMQTCLTRTWYRLYIRSHTHQYLQKNTPHLYKIHTYNLTNKTVAKPGTQNSNIKEKSKDIHFMFLRLIHTNPTNTTVNKALLFIQNETVRWISQYFVKKKSEKRLWIVSSTLFYYL